MNQLRSSLATAHVHIGGSGRVGTGIALALHAAGVSHISCNDPQDFDEEQLPWCVFSRRSDLGRPKVYVLERFFDGRPGFTFEPIVARNEDELVEPYLAQADLIVSCANALTARLHLEKAAIRLGKPSIQASVQDGRTALGGVISIWAPKAGRSCFGCLFGDRQPSFRRGEVLLPTITRMISDLAAHLAVQLLVGNAEEIARQHNLIALDARAQAIQSLSIERRKGCRVCGE
jgi:molybdopterin-synthase adenylyltransferase